MALILKMQRRSEKHRKAAGVGDGFSWCSILEKQWFAGVWFSCKFMGFLFVQALVQDSGPCSGP